MPKKGMKRPNVTHTKPKNDMPPVPEIKGKEKSGKVKANPLMETGKELTGEVFHRGSHKNEREVFDSDLEWDNLENNLPEADVRDL